MPYRISIHELCESQHRSYHKMCLEHNVPAKHLILVTSDDKTGQRFGKAMRRSGQCVKIGSGGRNKGQTGYQIWVSWSPLDILEYA